VGGRIGGRLAHYAYRNPPPCWRCRALPHQSRPSLRSWLLDITPEAALQLHSPTCGRTVVMRFAHRGVPGDDDGQVSLTSAFRRNPRSHGRRRWAEGRSPPRHRTTSETTPTRNFRSQECHHAATALASRNGWGHAYSMGKNACSSRPVHALAPGRAREGWAPTSLQSSHGSSLQAPVVAWSVPTRSQPHTKPAKGDRCSPRVQMAVAARLIVLDQWRPGALLSSDDYGSSVDGAAKLHPLWQGL
jgi:hypothetical protein